MTATPAPSVAGSTSSPAAPTSSPFLVTAVGGGSGLNQAGAKLLTTALANGGATMGLLNALQGDSSAMKTLMLDVMGNGWASSSANGAFTSTISAGTCSATISVQPLSAAVRARFNPGDTESSYMLTMSMSGTAMWGGSQYFLAFNGLDAATQTALIEGLMGNFRQTFVAIANYMAANKASPVGAAGSAEMNALQQQVEQIFSQPIAVAGVNYLPAFAISAAAAGGLGVIVRTLFARGGVFSPVNQYQGQNQNDDDDDDGEEAGEGAGEDEAGGEIGGDIIVATCGEVVAAVVSCILFVVAVIIIVVGVIVLLYDFVENTYYHTLLAINLTTSCDLTPSVAAVDNASLTPISGALTGQTLSRAFVIPGDPQNATLGMPCFGLNAMTMSNQGQTTFMEGFNYLALYTSQQTGTPLQNAALVFNIPRFKDNSMAAWVNPAATTNYQSLLTSNESANEQLNYSTNANGITIDMTMSALDDASNDQYYSIVVISDTTGKAALEAWAG